MNLDEIAAWREKYYATHSQSNVDTELFECLMLKAFGQAGAASVAEEWVSVKNWPVPSEWCFVVIGGVVQRTAARRFGQRHVEWADDTADCAPIDVVTHWRPLPEPPSYGLTEKESEK